jgi:hypothetical protein
MLVGALFGPGCEGGGDFHALGKFGAACRAGGSFYITPRCFGRRAATRGNRRYRTFELDSTPYKRHNVAGTQLPGGLYTLAVDVDLATGNRLGRQGTRLEQAHAKEPPVNAGGSRTFIAAIIVHGREYN